MDAFKIKVKIGTSEMEIDVSNSTKISAVKRSIQQRANVAFIKKKLTYSGKTLDDDLTLSQLGIGNGSKLEVENA